MADSSEEAGSVEQPVQEDGEVIFGSLELSNLENPAVSEEGVSEEIPAASEESQLQDTDPAPELSPAAVEGSGSAEDITASNQTESTDAEGEEIGSIVPDASSFLEEESPIILQEDESHEHEVTTAGLGSEIVDAQSSAVQDDQDIGGIGADIDSSLVDGTELEPSSANEEGGLDVSGTGEEIGVQVGSDAAGEDGTVVSEAEQVEDGEQPELPVETSGDGEASVPDAASLESIVDTLVDFDQTDERGTETGQDTVEPDLSLSESEVIGAADQPSVIPESEVATVTAAEESHEGPSGSVNGTEVETDDVGNTGQEEVPALAMEELHLTSPSVHSEGHEEVEGVGEQVVDGDGILAAEEQNETTEDLDISQPVVDAPEALVADLDGTDVLKSSETADEALESYPQVAFTLAVDVQQQDDVTEAPEISTDLTSQNPTEKPDEDNQSLDVEHSVPPVEDSEEGFSEEHNTSAADAPAHSALEETDPSQAAEASTLPDDVTEVLSPVDTASDHQDIAAVEQTSRDILASPIELDVEEGDGPGDGHVAGAEESATVTKSDEESGEAEGGGNPVADDTQLEEASVSSAQAGVGQVSNAEEPTVEYNGLADEIPKLDVQPGSNETGGSGVDLSSAGDIHSYLARGQDKENAVMPVDVDDQTSAPEYLETLPLGDGGDGTLNSTGENEESTGNHVEEAAAIQWVEPPEFTDSIPSNPFSIRESDETEAPDSSNADGLPSLSPGAEEGADDGIIVGADSSEELRYDIQNLPPGDGGDSVQETTADRTAEVSPPEATAEDDAAPPSSEEVETLTLAGEPETGDVAEVSPPEAPTDDDTAPPSSGEEKQTYASILAGEPEAGDVTEEPQELHLAERSAEVSPPEATTEDDTAPPSSGEEKQTYASILAGEPEAGGVTEESQERHLAERSTEVSTPEATTEDDTAPPSSGEEKKTYASIVAGEPEAGNVSEEPQEADVAEKTAEVAPLESTTKDDAAVPSNGEWKEASSLAVESQGGDVTENSQIADSTDTTDAAALPSSGEAAEDTGPVSAESLEKEPEGRPSQEALPTIVDPNYADKELVPHDLTSVPSAAGNILATSRNLPKEIIDLEKEVWDLKKFEDYEVTVVESIPAMVAKAATERFRAVEDAAAKDEATLPPSTAGADFPVVPVSTKSVESLLDKQQQGESPAGSTGWFNSVIQWFAQLCSSTQQRG